MNPRKYKIGDCVALYPPIVSANGKWATWSNTQDKYYVKIGAIGKITNVTITGYGIDFLPGSNMASGWFRDIKEEKKKIFNEELENI
jgi:hypothetical protein